MKTGVSRGSTALLTMLAAAALVSLFLGAAHLSASEVWRGLLGSDEVTTLIVREIRLPRMLLAVSIGGFLGMAGAALQGLMQNPLAEAAVFGAPQSAALGAVIVLYLGFADALSLWLPLAAIAGALLSSLLLFAFAGRSASIVSFILAGLAIGSFAGAALALVINLSPNPFAITEIVFWLMGSLEDRSLRHVAMSLPFLVLAVAMLLANGNAYRALALGTDAATSLGVSVQFARWSTIIAVSLGIGASVAVSGSIGFVGLIAPHVARSLFGADPRRILLPSCLIGAILLTCADIAVRLIPSTTEIKIGALTSLLGAPLFAYLVLARRSHGGADL